MSNEELTQRAKNGDQAAILELWTNNQGFINTQIKKYTGYIEPEDATQECYFALLRAVDGYEPAAGAFTTYFSYWIRQRLGEIIYKNSTLSANEHEKIIKYRRAVATFEKEHGRTPSDLEAAAILDTTPEDLDKLRRADYTDRPESLENETAEGRTLAESIPGAEDPEAETIEKEFSEELRAVVWDTVDTLPEEQADTIRARYKDGETLQEISNNTGDTISATAWKEKRALKELKKGKRGRTLRAYYVEIYGDALRGEGVNHFNATWESSTEREGIRLYERTRPD